MSDAIGLEVEVEEVAIRAWVLDDIIREGNQVANSIRAAGVDAECIKLSEINLRIHNVLSGRDSAPDVALIDLQWNVGQSQIELGDTVIVLKDKSRFGIKLAEYIRSFEEFRRCTIVIATQYIDRDIDADLEELGMAVLIPKKLIRDLPDKVRQLSGRTDGGRIALSEIGLRVHPESVRGSNPSLVEGAARDLGLEGQTFRLAGATKAGVDLAEFLESSRDARERVTMLRKIVVGLHELFGRPLPSIDVLERELKLDLRMSLLSGNHMDLYSIIWALEDRGGGGSVHD